MRRSLTHDGYFEENGCCAVMWCPSGFRLWPYSAFTKTFFCFITKQLSCQKVCKRKKDVSVFGSFYSLLFHLMQRRLFYLQFINEFHRSFTFSKPLNSFGLVTCVLLRYIDNKDKITLLTSTLRLLSWNLDLHSPNRNLAVLFFYYFIWMNRSERLKASNISEGWLHLIFEKHVCSVLISLSSLSAAVKVKNKYHTDSQKKTSHTTV